MRRRQFAQYRERAVALRKLGKSYSEIQKALRVKIPKSTLSLWSSGAVYTDIQRTRIERRIKLGGEIGRTAALAIHRQRRREYFSDLFRKNSYLRRHIFSDIKTAKAILVTLYLAEGSKSSRGRLTFGNSNPQIITLFLDLMRFVYAIDNDKFRCTVQCRADQDIPGLEKFWSKITSIPRRQFYSARVDPRSIGKVSLKKNYMAVCRLDYFKADVYNDLSVAGKVILGDMGPVAQLVERAHGMREARGS